VTYPQGDPPVDEQYLASGGIFRVDVENGLYRFVAAFGECDNPHASRVIAEDGGSGGPSNFADGAGGSLGENYVVLVNNHDQAQYNHGQARPTACPGCGVFARVGFNCNVPPLGDGIGADPQFVNYGPDGLPTGPGADELYGTLDDPPPESPTLEVTQGYIRFHLLQGNSNDGPGGKNFDAETGIGARDANGTDIVVLELWKVGEVTDPCAGRDEDTHCQGIDVTGPDGDVPGTYTVTATAIDDAGDPISYTFTADNGVDPVTTIGPQSENEAQFELTAGTWTIRVVVDDECPLEAADNTCTQDVVVVAAGGIQKPMDENQDGKFDLSDAVSILNHLFLGSNPTLPCGDGKKEHPANKALLNANGDANVDLSDAVYALTFLFLGGPEPVNCGGEASCPCIVIPDCPDNPIGDCQP
jgi:hypothetical protein